MTTLNEMLRKKATKKSCSDDNLKEKIEGYQRGMQRAFIEMDMLEEKSIKIVDNHIKTIKMGMSTELKQMKMGQYLDAIGKLSRFTDFKASDHIRMLASLSLGRSDDGDTSNDSGLGTEVSTNTNSEGSQRNLRSRSACSHQNVFNSARSLQEASTMDSSNRNSRRTKRPPMAMRRKALSVDRNLSNLTSPVTFLRYPKPTESILSKCGSPMMAQPIPNTFANINIPTRDGVLCVTSKELVDDRLSTNLVKTLDEDGFNQIRILHSNLQRIAKLASK